MIKLMFKTSPLSFCSLFLALILICSFFVGVSFYNVDAVSEENVPCISNSYLRGVKEGVSYPQLKELYTEKKHGSEYHLCDINGNYFTIADFSHIVSTGDYIIDGYNKKHIVVVTGDIDGDGSVSITDTAALKMHFSDSIKLVDANFQAADANYDGNITVTDFIRIKFHIQQQYNIYENEEFTPDETSSADSSNEEDDWTSGWM